MHQGARMTEIYKALHSKALNVEDVQFVKSKVATYAIVQATLKSTPSLKDLQEICNEYLCRAKIICTHNKATITFYDEPAED